AYVTGQDGGGHAFQRVAPNPVQPQSVAIATPLRQALHAGAQTTYVFTVTNAGADDTFDLTATDDKGFVASADPAQVPIAGGAWAQLPVVLQPPADATPGTSEALTVRAASAGTPGVENFAALTSVVEPVDAPTTTTITSTTSTTLPCTTP